MLDARADQEFFQHRFWPVVIALRPRRVKPRVRGAVVRFLINDEPLRARGGEPRVVGRFHRGDFQRERRNLRRERAHAAFEVSAGDEFRMLACDEEHVAKTFLGEMPRLFHHGVDLERDAEDRILAREAAVGAGVDALVGKIERREKADRFSKMPPRERGGFARERLQLRVVARLEQRGEAAHERRAGGGFGKVGHRWK